ncbi:MAG: adenylate cyclase, partial [Proteobacteria bacterium]
MITSGSNDIETWLHRIGLAEYATLFRENDLDLTLLPDLTNDDLKELGITSLGHRKQLLKAIAEFRTDEKVDTAERIEPTATTEAERRQLTVMFCDLVGSTALSAQYDPEDLSHIVRTYQDACAGIISRYEGYIARFMGDGMLVYFGYPQAHEDDAERALRTGLEIIERVGQLKPRENLTLQTRVGVATGLVVVGKTIGEASSREQVVMGETPNLAARLQGLAEPDQLVIAESTHRLCGDVFDYYDLGEQRLKGFDNSISAYAVIGERSIESRFAARSGQHLLPIVGREQEIALLAERWRLAKAGEGQLALLTGEAGIGKSRITRAMIDAVAEDSHFRINYQCSPYHSDSALYPAIRQLILASDITSTDDLDTRFDKLDTLLRQAGDIDTEQSALMATLIGLDGEGRYGALDLTPQQKRACTLQALVDQLVGLSEQNPVLFILEDAHWIDPTTQELIDLFLDAITDARVLILVTARATFEHGFGGHPIVTRLMLNRLGREHISSIVARLTNNKNLPDELLDEIVAKTDGVPLFVEELTKTILESGLLKETDTTFELEGPLSSLSIPTSLHDSLMARLDRLQPVKEVAQMAACIGREFGHSILSAVSPLSDSELQAALVKLIEAELVYRRGLVADATYQFKHALVRDAAYESLLKSKRQQIHARLVEALEATESAAPELLAQHATEAGMGEQAVEYWLQAGTHAAERSAHREAVGHFNRGLAVLGSLPVSTHRDEQEVQFQIGLCNSLNTAIGWGSEETVKATARARELCESLGKTDALLHVLRQERVIRWIRADYRGALAIATQMISLAEQQDDPRDAAVYRFGDVGIGHFLRLWPTLAMGEIATVQTVANKILDRYDPDQHSDYRFHYGIDLRAATLAIRGYARWLSGYPEQASSDNAQAVAYARELNHASSLTWALTWAGAQPAVMGRDARAAETFANELMEQQCSPMDIAWARICSGWAMGKRGQREAGISMLREGLDYLGAEQGRVFRSLHLALLAELYIDGKEFELAAQTLDEAKAHIARSEERFWEAEIYRLTGELHS